MSLTIKYNSQPFVPNDEEYDYFNMTIEDCNDGFCPYKYQKNTNLIIKDNLNTSNYYWNGYFDKSHFEDYTSYTINSTNAIGYYEDYRNSYQQLVSSMSKITVGFLDEYCKKFNLGISSSDFGFSK